MPARGMRGQAREGRGTIRPQKRVNKTRTAAMVLQATSLPAGAYSSGRKDQWPPQYARNVAGGETSAKSARKPENQRSPFFTHGVDVYRSTTDGAQR